MAGGGCQRPAMPETAPPASLLPGAEHFRVDELPAYEPSGSGEHLYVLVEKRGATSDQLIGALARACGRKRRDVGSAGRKDRHAITTQWFSIHFGDPAGLEELDDLLPEAASARVLQVERHGNKLRTGHLRGNRFSLAIDAGDSDLTAAIASVQQHGLINRFGVQRFGLDGANLRIARALGRGEDAEALRWLIDPREGAWETGQPPAPPPPRGPAQRVWKRLSERPDDPGRALRSMPRDLRQLIASAAQSAIFNAVCDQRVAAGLLHDLRVGDVAGTPRGACFVVGPDDLADCRRRVDPQVGELLTTGPMPGRKMVQPGVAVLQEERQWSAATDMDWDWFTGEGPLASSGERRPLRVPLLEPIEIKEHDSRTWLRFALPAGSFATEVLDQCGIAMPEERRGSA